MIRPFLNRDAPSEIENIVGIDISSLVAWLAASDDSGGDVNRRITDFDGAVSAKAGAGRDVVGRPRRVPRRAAQPGNQRDKV